MRLLACFLSRHLGIEALTQVVFIQAPVPEAGFLGPLYRMRFSGEQPVSGEVVIPG